MAQKKRGPGRPKGSKNKNTVTQEQKKYTPEEKVKKIQEENKKDKRLRDELWAVIIIAIGSFFAVSVFSKGAGIIGDTVGAVLKGLFGAVSCVLPIVLVVYGVLLISKKAQHFTLRTFIFLFLTIVMICAGYSIINFIEEGNIAWSMDIVKNYYTTGVEFASGGFFGMILGSALISWLGNIGCWIFIVVAILVFILLLINTPLSKLIERIGDKIEERKLLKEEAANNYAEEKQEIYANNQYMKYVDNEISQIKHDIKIVSNEPLESEKEETPIIPLTEDKKKSLIGFMNDENLFGSKKTQTTGLEEKEQVKEGYGLGEDIVTTNKEKTLGIDEKIVSIKSVETIEPEPIRSSSSNPKKYKLPPITILNNPIVGVKDSNTSLKERAAILEETLRSFDVDAEVVLVTQGPTVTRYEVQPAIGVRVSKIETLADDIALRLAAKSIRIEAPIPGKSAVGIEVENSNVNTVTIREVIDSNEFRSSKSRITIGIGKDISGKSICYDLKSLPHLLIAGSTGSGKSVCINTIIASLMYKATPDEVRFILIDPKQGVELGKYNGIPYLKTPVVTDAKQAVSALNWAVLEMERRYKMFAEIGVRDFESYNDYLRANGEAEKVIPNYVIIIDELADLMMVSKSQIEESICRIAQLARAAGMHLIVATQRPSVNVVTGLIKANIPSRIAFAVSSQMDSRVVLDMNGAERLVGKGDMLFNPIGISKPIRVQGAFISDLEVKKLIDFSKKQASDTPDNLEPLTANDSDNSYQTGMDNEDEILPEAIDFVVRSKKASTSMLQRRFRLGYSRAARLIDIMEERGIIGPQDGSRPREVLISVAELEEIEEGK